jgi:hypothetical protein
MQLGRAQYRKVRYREKRKDRRVLFPPISITIEGMAFETNNWSFGGFMVDGCGAALAAGETISGTLGWGEVRFPFIGRVSRVGGEMKELAVSFVDISDVALLYLDHLLSDYLASKRSAR